MIQSTLTTSYVFGHPGEESQRLLSQSRLYNSCTRRFLEQAGITAGMKVLDVGSGAGDVTFLAGELVGPRGMVVGVEHDLTMLETARARACAAGLTQVSFVAGDLRNVALASEFDAVIGRDILLYLIDPVALLRVGVQHLRPGGIVAFQEFDFSVIERLVAAEGAPAFSQQLVRWMSAGFRRVGASVQLHRHRTRLGRLVEYGIVQAGEVDIDMWSERLRAEVSQQTLFIASGILVGAWTRVGQIVDIPLHA